MEEVKETVTLQREQWHEIAYTMGDAMALCRDVGTNQALRLADRIARACKLIGTYED